MNRLIRIAFLLLSVLFVNTFTPGGTLYAEIYDNDWTDSQGKAILHYNYNTETKHLEITPLNGNTEVPYQFYRNWNKNWKDYDYDITLKSLKIGEGFTSIGNEAFWRCQNLAHLELPDGLLSIGDNSFNMNYISYTDPHPSQLTEITIPNTVTHIGNAAFAGAALSSITLPSSLQTLGRGAFLYCNNITTVTIPKSVTTIDMFVFGGTDSQLAEYIVDPENANFTAKDGVLYNKTMTKLISIPRRNTTTTIPKGVTTLAGSSLYELTTKVTLPSTLTTLEDYTFYNYHPTNIVLPEGVTTIAPQAFYCSYITSLTLPNSVSDESFANLTLKCRYPGELVITLNRETPPVINENFFTNANSEVILPKRIIVPSSTVANNYRSAESWNSVKDLIFSDALACGVVWSKSSDGTELTLSSKNEATLQIASTETDMWSSIVSGVTKVIINNNIIDIDASAFQYNTTITEVDFSSTKLYRLLTNSFNGCTNLTTVHFAENGSLTSLGQDCFMQSGLTSITIPKTVQTFSNGVFQLSNNLETVIFEEGSQLTSLTFRNFAGCGKLKNIVLPENINSLGAECFSSTAIEEITLPASLTTIETSCFISCSSLKTVNAYCTALTKVGTDAFKNIAESARAYGYANNGAAALEDYFGTNYYVVAGTIGNANWTRNDELGLETKTILKVSLADLNGDKTVPADLVDTIDSYNTSHKVSDEVEYLDIADGFTEIGDRAFKGLNSSDHKLYLRHFSKDVEIVGEEAFMNAWFYEEYDFSTSAIKIVKDRAFYFAGVLFKNQLPPLLEEIGNEAFSRCRYISGYLPEGLKTIGDKAFYRTEYVNNSDHYGTYFVPASVESIGNMAFCQDPCGTGVLYFPYSYFHEVKVAEGNTHFVTVPGTSSSQSDSFLYEIKDGKKIRLLQYYSPYRDDATESYTFDKNLETIDDDALVDSPYNVMTFYNKLKKVGRNLCTYRAVKDGTMRGIYIYASTPPELSETQTQTAVLIVPSTSENAYIESNWKNKFQMLDPVKTRRFNDAETYSDYSTNSYDYGYIKRTFNHTGWQALYAPIELDCEWLADDYDIAYINDVHQFDDDDDGEIDRTVLEVIKKKTGKTSANIPYLIRPKQTGEQEIPAFNLTTSEAWSPTFEVSSWFTKYIFHTTYQGVTGSDMVSNGYYAMSDGKLVKATDTSYNLSPNRWYLEIQTRSGGSAAPKSIDIIEDGDEDNPTTGIFECVTDSNGGRTINDNVIYDLNGRAVKRGTSLEGMPSGLYILNGKKIVK